MPDLTRDQKNEAVDMARGLLLAQSQGAPYHNLRTMLESNAMIAIPHAEKVEMLRQYARMENEPPYQTTVNTSKSPAVAAATIAGKTLAGGVGTALLGGTIDFLRKPDLHQNVAKHGLTKVLRVYAKMNKVPLGIVAALGAGAAGVSAVRHALAQRKYENNVRNALSRIREEENPNPYINALLMSNRLHIDALSARKSKIIAGGKEFKEAVPAIAPFASMAVPHIIDPELDVPIIRGAFGELS